MGMMVVTELLAAAEVVELSIIMDPIMAHPATLEMVEMVAVLALLMVLPVRQIPVVVEEVLVVREDHLVVPVDLELFT